MIKRKLSTMLVLVGLLVFSFGCNQNYDETILEKDIAISGDIKGIFVDGVWEVNVMLDESTNDVFITYSAYAEDKISVEMNPDGYLYLKVKKLNTHGHKLVLTATVSATMLEKIQASGAAKISIIGSYESENIALLLSGASSLSGLLAKASSMDIDLSGASSITDMDFSGKSLNCKLHGASSIKKGVCTAEQLTFKAEGASSYYFSGDATSANFVGNGASHFYTQELELDNLSVLLEGASYAEVFVKQIIAGKLEGASTLKYKIGADVTGVQTSGGSSMIQIP